LLAALIRGVEGVEACEAAGAPGAAIAYAEIAPNGNAEEIRRKVADLLAQARPAFPKGAGEPQLAALRRPLQARSLARAASEKEKVRPSAEEGPDQERNLASRE
jgi:hypothetical protein